MSEGSPVSERLLNRELSWLDFNARVLALSDDERVPLLERVKFSAIFSSNLDEFFQVRVAALKDQVAAGVTRPTPDGRTAAQQLIEISDRVELLVKEQERVLLDDAGVALRVGGGRGGRLEVDQRGHAPHRVEQAGPPQLVGDGDGIGGLAGRREVGDGLEDVPVSRLVEIGGGEHLRRHRDGVFRQEHGAEQRLLGLEVVRRNPPRIGAPRRGTGGWG